MDQSEIDGLNGSHRLRGYGVHESAVRIESRGGKICGTGVAITPRHIASCAHVVLEAMGLPSDQNETPSGVLRTTIWTNRKSRTVEIKRVVAWSSVHEQDLALLELPENEPDCLPACLETLRSDQWQEKTVDIFGFPESFDQGKPATLHCQTAIMDGRIQCRPDREGMDPGHSGGPVFLEGNLIGLGQSRRRFKNPERQYDYIVPLSLLEQLAPTWTRISRQPYFNLWRQIIAQNDSAADPQFDAECLLAIRACAPHKVDEYRLHRLARDYDTADIRLDFTPLLMLLEDKRRDSAFGEGSPPKPLENLNQAMEEDFPVFLLKGAPGAGKTTLLKRLAFDCVSDGNQPFLPVFVELAVHRGVVDAGPWLEQQWRRNFPAMPELSALRENYSVLWLLDGLNELPDEPDVSRESKIDGWRRWLDREVPRHRAIISCRSADYLDQLDVVGESQVPHLEVQPLDRDKIAEFLHNRSRLDRVQADAAITRIRERDLEKLYNTPLMLTLLEQVLSPEGDFPDGRADLFTAFLIKLVLRESDKGNSALRRLFSERELKALREAAKPSTLVLNNRPVRRRMVMRANPLFDALSTQAYEHQRSEFRGERQEVSFERFSLEDRIIAEHGQNKGEDILAAVDAMLLLVPGENEAMLRFRHQQFQEYFAARRLAGTLDLNLAKVPWQKGEFGESLERVRAAMKSWQQLPGVDRSGWEETVLLAAELAEDGDEFVNRLASVNLPLAGQCAARAGLSESAQEGLAKNLLVRMRDGEADLRARIAAGSALGEMDALEVLGYQRVDDGQGNVVAWRPPLAGIPAGHYTFGSLDDPEADDDETRFEQELGAFEIGIYPVTNAEWRCFIKADGYEDPRWWLGDAAREFFDGRGTNEGQAQAWIWWKRQYEEGVLDDRLDSTSNDPETQDMIRRTVQLSRIEWEEHLSDVRARSEKITEPAWWRASRYNNPLQPVVGISFYEAAAYCRWLSAVCGREYTLPSELEWEAAARGSGPHPRKYAYGDVLCGEACNIREPSAIVGAPTPVGLYASGKTPDSGIYELTGNTWDWCRSLYRESPPYSTEALAEIREASQLRVLRGGSWSSILRNARAAYRGSVHPDGRNDDVGCRVCCVPLES